MNDSSSNIRRSFSCLDLLDWNCWKQARKKLLTHTHIHTPKTRREKEVASQHHQQMLTFYKHLQKSNANIKNEKKIDERHTQTHAQKRKCANDSGLLFFVSFYRSRARALLTTLDVWCLLRIKRILLYQFTLCAPCNAKTWDIALFLMCAIS